jgi:hypothetical protein
MKNMKKNNIGRWCMVRAFGEYVGATVMDLIAGTNKPKRIRLQTGEHAGEVRTLGEYDFIEFSPR